MKAIEHDCASRETLRLSAHEIATPLLLLHASVDLIAATPDVISLRESELVHLVESGKAKLCSRSRTKEMPCCGYWTHERQPGPTGSPGLPAETPSFDPACSTPAPTLQYTEYLQAAAPS